MTPTAPPEVPSRPRRRIFLWIAGGVVGLVVLLLAIYPWLARDEPPPDVRDLVFVPHNLPPQENAYVVLMAAAQLVDRAPWDGDDELFNEMSKGQSWDAAKASRWLAANQPVWASVSRAASLPLSQGPVIRNLKEITPDVGPLRRLVNLSMLRAWSLHRDGKHDEAFAWLATWLRAAQRIEDSRSTFILWLTGLATHGIAIDTIRGLATATPPSASQAIDLVSVLEQTRPSATGLADTIRAERVLMTFVLEQMKNAPGRSQLDDESSRLIGASRQFSILLKPHRTERLYAEHLRGVIGRIESDSRTIHAAIPEYLGLLGTGWRRWSPDNAVGRIVLSAVTPTLHTLLEKRLRANSAVSATQAFIALRRCETERGSLPEALGELVPAYLPKVPRDYCDGAEIRYSREHRAVWSVAKNGRPTTQSGQEIESNAIHVKLPAATR